MIFNNVPVVVLLDTNSNSALVAVLYCEARVYKQLWR